MATPQPPSPTTKFGIEKPTATDVLLGRGVAINRHPGNENFRDIVGKHVDVYVTSTKKQKMMISRSIVDAVHKRLSPPGRFLEKDAKTGLWSEVGDKKALEKTSQALRDGAAPLRKQLSEDMSDPSFLAAVFDDDQPAETPRQISVQPKGHRRAKTTPGRLLFRPNENETLPRTKKLRSGASSPNGNNDVYPTDFRMENASFPSSTVISSPVHDLSLSPLTTHSPVPQNDRSHRRHHTMSSYYPSRVNESFTSKSEIVQAVPPRPLFSSLLPKSAHPPPCPLRSTNNRTRDERLSHRRHNTLETSSTCHKSFAQKFENNSSMPILFPKVNDAHPSCDTIAETSPLSSELHNNFSTLEIPELKPQSHPPSTKRRHRRVHTTGHSLLDTPAKNDFNLGVDIFAPLPWEYVQEGKDIWQHTNSMNKVLDALLTDQPQKTDGKKHSPAFGNDRSHCFGIQMQKFSSSDHSLGACNEYDFLQAESTDDNSVAKLPSADIEPVDEDVISTEESNFMPESSSQCNCSHTPDSKIRSDNI